MPRVNQVDKFQPLHHQDHLPFHRLNGVKMPNSSAGDSPRSHQPAKPVTPTIHSPSTRRSLFEDQQGHDIKPGTTFLSNHIKSPATAPAPQTPPALEKKFFRGGGLAESVQEVKWNNPHLNPVKRNKHLYNKKSANVFGRGPYAFGHNQEKTKEPSSTSDESKVAEVPTNIFYSSPSPPKPAKSYSASTSGGLQERDVNSQPSTSYNFSFSTTSSSPSKPEDKKIDLVTLDDDDDDKPLVRAESSLPEKLEPHKVGLKNRGNTCYLNSTVQALLGLPMVVTDATNLKHAVMKRNINTDNTKLVLPFTSLCWSQSQGDVIKTNDMAKEVKQDMEQVKIT